MAEPNPVTIPTGPASMKTVPQVPKPDIIEPEKAEKPTRTWRYVEIDFPPLAIGQGVSQVMMAIIEAAGQGLFEETAAMMTLMQLCGIDDAAYKTRLARAQKQERTAQAMQIAQGQGARLPMGRDIRGEFPSGARRGVRSPDRKPGAPAVSETEEDDWERRELQELPPWEKMNIAALAQDLSRWEDERLERTADRFADDDSDAS